MVTLGLPHENNIGDHMAGDAELLAVESVNQSRGDIGCIRRRDSQPDLMLLSYKG